MTLIEQVRVLYPDFGTTDISKMLKTRQTTIKKIIDDNNFKLIKNRRINIDDFYNIQKKEISYLLGLIWADGHLSKRDNTLSIECVSDDMIYFKETLDKVGRWSYHNRRRNDNTRNTRPVTNAYICDSLLHKFLEENDYLEKSKKSPEKIVEKIPKHLLGYFLLGIVDGDGCFYFMKSEATQFTIAGDKNQEWFYIERLFINLDIKYTIVTNNSSSVIRVTNKNDIRKIGNFIYSTIEDDNIGLRRKYDKYKLIINTLIKNDILIEYIRKSNKPVSELLKELNISRFRLNKIMKNII
jgi:hypothetical protein